MIYLIASFVYVIFTKKQENIKQTLPKIVYVSSYVIGILQIITYGFLYHYIMLLDTTLLIPWRATMIFGVILFVLSLLIITSEENFTMFSVHSVAILAILSISNEFTEYTRGLGMNMTPNLNPILIFAVFAILGVSCHAFLMQRKSYINK